MDSAREVGIYVGGVDDHPIYQPNYKGVWNVEQGKLACIAGKNYQIVQHAELLNGTLQALNNLGVPYKVNDRAQGNRMFVDVEFPTKTIKLSQVGEEFAVGIRVINSYDKNSGVGIVTRVVRLVCANGMVMKANGESFVMKHNSNFVNTLQSQIEITINKIISSNANLQEVVNSCIADSVEWELTMKILNGVIGRKKHIDEIKKQLPTDRAVTRWDIYNAVTHYATHNEQLKPNVEAWLQGKAEKIMRTESSKLPAIEVEAE